MGENKIKKLFENTKLLVALIALLVIVIAAVVVCCVIAGNSGDSGEWKSEKYVYQNTIPCTDQPDAWMTIDGNITEAEWQDNKWMTYKTKGITYSVTTEFTETGIYIAGKAEDRFVYHYGDYAFANNTCFKVSKRSFIKTFS